MGTGGSRLGAGRPGWRRKCEQSLPLDVRVLHRHGRLQAGGVFPWRWTWSNTEESAGTISIASREASVELRYTWTPSAGAPQHKAYSVELERTPCRYGGTRPWFRCPWCSRRVALLYGLSSDGYFGCRLCLRLAYMSEAESRTDRILRKLHKLEANLGEDGEKPKWMRWRTFERICERCAAADRAWGAMALARFGPAILRYIET